MSAITVVMVMAGNDTSAFEYVSAKAYVRPSLSKQTIPKIAISINYEIWFRTDCRLGYPSQCYKK